MTITFRIQYHTTWGETLRALIDDGPETELSTVDGNVWQGQTHFRPAHPDAPVSYRYAVYRDGHPVRVEFGAMPSTGTDTPFAWSSVQSRTPSARWTMIRATISCKTPGATCPRIPTASAPPSATQVKKARERHSCSPQATRASSSASCVLPETRNAAHWPYPATARRWETGQLPPRSGCRRYAPTCGNWPWTPLS